MADYPLVGFHFRADFILPSVAKPQDIFFQSIDGLSASMIVTENKSVPVYSFNRFRQDGMSFSDLVLRRGLITGSNLINYFEMSLFSEKIVPIPLVISVLDEEHLPVYAWMFMNAFPVKWETSGFDAMKNEILIETITMKYAFYKQLYVKNL